MRSAYTLPPTCLTRPVLGSSAAARRTRTSRRLRSSRSKAEDDDDSELVDVKAEIDADSQSDVSAEKPTSAWMCTAELVKALAWELIMGTALEFDIDAIQSHTRISVRPISPLPRAPLPARRVILSATAVLPATAIALASESRPAQDGDPPEHSYMLVVRAEREYINMGRQRCWAQRVTVGLKTV
ncbi:hypothetical protein HMN09_00923700 [Mycena chlorophos]|uniref:Uncharacterized protein n=1 Tax=Mycena chlorophos TaxID=658473 RepID=A0A8H6SM78_MYCCL|nr:hypothetical protein HMN09_00923700 [Mycena chlorophos]